MRSSTPPPRCSTLRQEDGSNTLSTPGVSLQPKILARRRRFASSAFLFPYKIRQRFSGFLPEFCRKVLPDKVGHGNGTLVSCCCGTASALPKCSIMSGCGTRIVLRGQKPLALCDRCPCFGSLYPPLAALTFAASSIICAFGLAAAVPRSPYRHLELCGIALALCKIELRKYQVMAQAPIRMARNTTLEIVNIAK